jgi:hypothetical protein
MISLTLHNLTSNYANASFFVKFFIKIIIFLLITKNVICTQNKNKRYLTNVQLSKINSIFSHPGTTNEMKNEIKDKIFEIYEKTAFKKSILFKQNYKSDLKHVDVNELYLYSLSGLWYAIQNYNPSLYNKKYNIHNYIIENIDDSLYNGYIKLLTIEGIFFQ